MLGLNTQFIREVGVLRWVRRYGWRQFSKRVLRRENTLRLPTGLRMHLPRYSGNATEIYVTGGNIDCGSESLMAALATPQDDFLDIGSHIGYYAAYMSPRVRNVYAFEPDARNLATLQQNAALATNIHIVEQAVSSTEGTQRFYAGAGSEVGSLEAAPDGTAPAGDSTTVNTTTVDAFAAQHPGLRPTLIKTDVEGHDMEVLKGMEATIRTWQPLVLSECGDAPGLPALCERWGYSVFAFTGEMGRAEKRLEELDPHKLANYWFKMLFLVPPRLREQFRAKIAR